MNSREVSVFSIKGIFDCETILYIGASEARADLTNHFIVHNKKIDLIEVFKRNADYHRDKKIFRNVYLADITKTKIGYYDAIIWWHGIEHVEKEKVINILKYLESRAKNYVLLGCPWGIQEQKESNGNKYEKHLWTVYEEFFEKLGYKYKTLGNKDKRPAHITAYKFIN